MGVHVYCVHVHVVCVLCVHVWSACGRFACRWSGWSFPGGGKDQRVGPHKKELRGTTALPEFLLLGQKVKERKDLKRNTDLWEGKGELEWQHPVL